MNILVVTDDFTPKKGGIAHTLSNFYDFVLGTEHNLYILNPFCHNDNVFNIINTQDFERSDFLRNLTKKLFIKNLIYSFLCILSDKKIRLIQRIKIILYFMLKLKILTKVIINIYNIRPILKELNYNVILSAHSGWLLPLTFILSRIFNKKLITMAHGNDFLVQNRLSLKPYFFKNVDKIIVSNRIMLKLISKIHNLDDNKIEIIRRGVDLNSSDIKLDKQELREELQIPENHFVLLSVGRHIARKNFSDVIKAINIILERNPQLDIMYYLIGEGEETKNLKKLVRSLKIEQYVKFLGSCNEKTRNMYYKLSDVFVMPVKPVKYDLEGFGIVFLEANFFKTPVIGSLVGGIPEAILDKKTGLLVKPNDLEDLVEKIMFLYDHIEIREELGKNGHQRVVNYFNWKIVGNEYIKLFESLSKN